MRIFFNPTCLTLVTVLSLAWPCSSQAAAPSFRFTANMNEAVNVDTAGGTPSIPITVGDKPRSAVYTSGSGTAALTFTYTATPGDLDLDGIAVSSPIALNGGGIADLAGNQIAPADLAFAPAPTTTGVLISYPSLSMDFVNDKYTYNGSVYNSFSSFKTASNASFSNDTNGTYFDAAGTLHKTAVANTPRMDYDPVTHVAKGVLLEEQRTNYQRDSEFSALSVASYAAYTEIASTWIVVTNNIGTIDITGKGTVNGLSYIDVHFQMNNVTGVEQYPGLLTFPTDRVAVTPGQSTMFSAWVGVSSYASSGACYLALSNRSMNAGGGYIIEKSHYWTAPSAFAPVETPILTHGAGAALAEGYFYIAVPAGATCDITMRYAAPQFEIGEYKTSYIPTAGATVTRAADVFTIPTAGGWYDQAKGTDYLNMSYATSLAVGAAASPVMVRFDDTTDNNYWGTYYDQLAGNVQMAGYNGGASQGGFSKALASAASVKYASAQISNNTNMSFDGNIAADDTTWTPPAVTRLNLSTAAGGVAKWIKEYRYYPLRAENAQLQKLTQ